jgi:hypothetical protein
MLPLAFRAEFYTEFVDSVNAVFPTEYVERSANRDDVETADFGEHAGRARGPCDPGEALDHLTKEANTSGGRAPPIL